MKYLLHCFVALLLLAVAGVGVAEQKAYEMPRTQVVPIKDSNTGRQYELYIRLPEGYSDTADTPYPVIYATDAVWHMEMLSGSTEYLMQNAIVVGISWQTDLGDDRAHASRSRDYTIVKYAQTDRPTGEALNHLSFIRDDVIKTIENNFRTDPDERTYFGYSAGGEFGAYILMTQPDSFKHYILGSPAFDQQSFAYLEKLVVDTTLQQQQPGVAVFLSIGELERPESMSFTREFESLLQQSKAAGIASTGLEIIENSDHGSAFPATVVRSIKWLSGQITE